MNENATSHQLEELAHQMQIRQKVITDPPRPFVLLLGAGTSMESGYPGNSRLVDEVIGIQEDLSECERRERFEETWASRGKSYREKILEQLFPPVKRSPGYGNLAELIARGFFEPIFTTNIDTLLEDALHDADLRRGDFAVGIAKLHTDQAFTDLFESSRPKIKIFKLHGDLRWGRYAFTQPEIFRFTGELQSLIRQHLRKDLVVIGYSLHDFDMLACMDEGDALWYVNPHPLSASARSTLARQTVNEISGDLGRFDAFCEGLRRLLIPSEPQVENLFESDFDTPAPLDGLSLVAGVADYFGGGTLGLGAPRRVGVLVVNAVLSENPTVETRFKILDDGQDPSNWVGFLLRARGPSFIGGGYLVYLRSNGRVELLHPDGTLFFWETELRPTEHWTDLKIEVSESTIRAWSRSGEGQPWGQPMAEWHDIGFLGQQVFVHTFGTNTRFERLKISGSRPQ